MATKGSIAIATQLEREKLFEIADEIAAQTNGPPMARSRIQEIAAVETATFLAEQLCSALDRIAALEASIATTKKGK